jgi:hypothetical protein
MLEKVRRWLEDLRHRVHATLERAARARREAEVREAIQLLQGTGFAVMQLRDAQDGAQKPGERGDRSEQGKLLRLVVDVATGLWRAQKRLDAASDADADSERRAVARHLHACRDALTGAAIELRDPTGEPYAAGMALKVVAFQPTDGVAREVVAEVIRPSVYYQGRLVQAGEVIVGTPPTATPAEAGSAERPSSPAESRPAPLEAPGSATGTTTGRGSDPARLEPPGSGSGA